MNTLFVFVVLTVAMTSFVSSQNHEIANCQLSCNAICESIELIRMSACRGICIDHCGSYSSIDMSTGQSKCLLTCKYLNYDDETCKPLCKVSGMRIETQRALAPAGNDTEVEEHHEDKIDVSNVCTGYGRELCYKICRLHHSENIETCLCACCKCKF